ncbi:MAG TPA: hypothetical protein VNF68_12780 [Candidatus Baltobacteraceae bacterium]|nr:hypothetical protein [Candidatus Baltobacteraceae bacterium]
MTILGGAIAFGAAILGIVLALTGRAHIASMGAATVAMYGFLVVVGRRPVQRMNFPAPLTPEQAKIVEPIVRVHLAGVTALTTGLFAWMEVAAALDRFDLYLWTCGLFVLGILLTLFGMVLKVGREQARGENRALWTP